MRCVTWTPVCQILIFKSRVTMSNLFNFVRFRCPLKRRWKKNASENVICSSRLLHILTNVGKQCGPNSAADSLCKQVGPRSGPTKSRAWSWSKLFDTFMEFLKSADDTVRHSITAFCHVCHLYTRAISALKSTKNVSTFDIKGHAKLISACCEHSCLSKAILPSRLNK